MNRPTPDQIQAMTELIAKLLGWMDICEPCAKSGDFHGVPPNKADQEKGVYRKIIRKTMPNWPRDRNASYELLHKMNAEDTRNAERKAQVHYRFILQTHPAIEECFIYLWHEGYRWVECDSCGGKGKIPVINNKAHLQYGMKMPCPACNGQGGKFVKEVTDG